MYVMYVVNVVFDGLLSTKKSLKKKIDIGFVDLVRFSFAVVEVYLAFLGA